MSRDSRTSSGEAGVAGFESVTSLLASPPAVRRVHCCQLEPLRATWKQQRQNTIRIRGRIILAALFYSVRNYTCKALLFRPGQNLGHPIEGQQLPGDCVHVVCCDLLNSLAEHDAVVIFDGNKAVWSRTVKQSNYGCSDGDRNMHRAGIVGNKDGEARLGCC